MAAEHDKIRPETPLEAPQALLERAIIDDYLRARGYDPALLKFLPARQLDDIFREAAKYAGGKMAEHEARAHYVQEIHGTLPPSYRPKARS